MRKWELALGRQRSRCEGRMSGSDAHKSLFAGRGRVSQDNQVAEPSGRKLGISMAVNSLRMDACKADRYSSEGLTRLLGVVGWWVVKQQASGLGAVRVCYVEGLPSICYSSSGKKQLQSSGI